MRRLLPVLCVAATLAPIACAAASTPAIAALAKQFDDHAVVMVGELHRSRETHAFLQQLLADPEFVCRVDDVVVESGNSRLQPLADAYASGGEVSEAQLQSMWRETAVPLAWNAPMYRAFYEAVRAVNVEHRCTHPVRLVLADAPLDWSMIATAADYAPFTDRDAAMATVVEREVLTKGHHALLVAGEFHAMKAMPPDLQEPGDGPVLAQILERDHPGALFNVVAVPNPDAAKALGLDDPPAFRPVRGNDLADRSFQWTDWDTKFVATDAGGTPGWTLEPDKHWPRMGDVVDGLLWLGGNHAVFPSPTIYLDPDYQRELRRRMAIIQAYGGQDFLSVLDDLVRQAKEGGDGHQTNVPKP